jgi:hypothetical protein
MQQWGTSTVLIESGALPDDPQKQRLRALNVAAILGALDRAGWDGYYDLEIFSDNGAFGNAYDGSLWDLQPTELAGRARESFMKSWEDRRVTA